jgi:hypothetical protein
MLGGEHAHAPPRLELNDLVARTDGHDLCAADGTLAALLAVELGEGCARLQQGRLGGLWDVVDRLLLLEPPCARVGEDGAHVVGVAVRDEHVRDTREAADVDADVEQDVEGLALAHLHCRVHSSHR